MDWKRERVEARRSFGGHNIIQTKDAANLNSAEEMERRK
jgi:hypothetical protein